MAVSVVPVTAGVIADLLPRLRPVDRLELDCMGSGDPFADIAALVRRSRRARAAYMDGHLVCIFGVRVTTELSDVGNPWALMTRAVDIPAIKREFVPGSRIAVDWLGQDFRRLWNLVAEENRTAIRWLRWLGFRFDGRWVELKGYRFLHFDMEVGPCASIR